MSRRLTAMGREILTATMFLSRLPLPRRWRTVPPSGLGAALRWAPAIGVVIAGMQALLVGAATAFGLPQAVTASLAVAVAVVATGALHEDGLADVADGFGGGWTRERKLAIMRDSRIGTFGALALGLGLMLRVACVASLLDRSALVAVAGLVAAAALSRACMLVPMAVLPPARLDGLAHAAGPVGSPGLVAALALGLAIAVAVLPGVGFGGRPILAAVVLGVLTSLGATALARGHIAGVTGDVVGATQQLAEIAILIALSGAHAG